MEPNKGILIRTFGIMAEADLAASQLRAAGIDCVISTDDCAGMYPSLGVIQLLVDPAVAEDARRILREATTTSASAMSLPEEKTPVRANTPPPRVYRFNSGLAVGVMLGVLLHFGYRHYEEHRDRTDRYYNDSDDSPDEEIVWRNGQTLERRFDRNGDSRWDLKTHFKDGLPVSDELDDNFDGKWDGALSYSARGWVSSGHFDTDFNGVPDLTVIYTNGLTLRSDWRTNGTKSVSLRQLYRDGGLEEELRDVNGDGLFDVSILFDRFITPIRTNSLRPTTQSP
jgi:hypothetical protein